MEGDFLTKGGKKQKISLSDLKDEIKLDRLKNEKRFADLELNVGNLNNKFKDIWKMLPDLKEKTERFEDMINVLILGTKDFKGNISDLNSQVNNLENKIEKLPDEFRKSLEEYNTQIQSIKKDINDLLADLGKLKKSEEKSLKEIEDKLMKNIETLREIGDKNKAEIELIHKNVDSLNISIRSFQKVLDMIDINSLTTQFDAINMKITNLNVELEKIKGSIPDGAVIDKEINVLSNKLQNIYNNLMVLRTDLGEKEKRILLDEVEIDKLKSSQGKLLEEAEAKIKKFEDIISSTRNLDVIASYGKEARKQLMEMESMKTEVEKLGKRVERMFFEINKRTYDTASLKPELERIKAKVYDMERKIEESIRKPASREEISQYLEALESRLAEQRKSIPDKTLMNILERIKLIEERISLLELRSKGTEVNPVIIE